MPLARRAVLRQLAPVLLSAAAPTLLWSPAQAAKAQKGARAPAVQTTIAKTIDVGQTLSFKLSEAWQGILPAKKMTIQSIAGAAQGTAMVQGRKADALVIYTPVTGFSGSDGFSISAIGNGVPYVVRVSVVVRPPAPPPGADAILVSDAAQLALALSSAQPGNRIVLADGIYAGDFTITQAGTQEQPILIEAARTLGATITGHFTVKAPDVALVGLNVTLGIDLGRDRARASRCKVDGSGLEPPLQISGGTGVVVEFCELTNFGGRGLQIEGGAREPRVYRNWVHGQYGSDSDAIAAIIAGMGKGTSATPIAAHILENRVEGLSARQAIETKSSGNRIERNTVVGADQACRRPGPARPRQCVRRQLDRERPSAPGRRADCGGPQPGRRVEVPALHRRQGRHPHRRAAAPRRDRLSDQRGRAPDRQRRQARAGLAL